MKQAYSKDIVRTIQKEKKRFIAIMIIALLGVCMLTGLKAACDDLRKSADLFFDEQNLFDLKVVSTLGLTEEDVETIASIQGIEEVEGAFSDTVYTMYEKKKKSVELKTLSERGINIPYIIEGKLPTKTNEIVVTQKYSNETGKKIGDTLILEDAKNITLLCEEYTISGIVIDVMDINSTEGTVAFRANSSTDYIFYVLPSAIESEVFTYIFITLSKTDGLYCYSEQYEEQVKTILHRLEAEVKKAREQARYDEIVGEALVELADARKEADEEFAKAEKEIVKAEQELLEAWKEIETAETTLKEQEQESIQQIEEAKAELEAGILQLETMAQQYGRIPDIERQLIPLYEAREALQIQEQEATEQIANAYKELETAKEEWQEGEATLQENKTEFESERADVYAELEEAKAEIDEIEIAEWYLSDRNALSGYANIKSDADCIEAIGKAFPVIFLTVAILISLTTITRMVEEDRGLIGTYKALGFTDREIRRKYLIYAVLASLFGSILGDVFGFIVLPEILFTIFSVMYQLPEYLLGFDYVYGLGGIALFVGVIAIAAVVSCEAELKSMPAMLMRPKVPRSGSRIFLEKIPVFWKRFSFLNKVTARNLFRYKKRFFMTVFGIMGCTALLVCGYTIKDTVAELMPKQYEKIYQYDLMLIAENQERIQEVIEAEDTIVSDIEAHISQVKLMNQEGEETTVQIIVIPDDVSIKPYISLINPKGKELLLEQENVFVTINASNLLEVKAGDTIAVQNVHLEQANVTITDITMNYMGNHMYMTASMYEKLFGAYEGNGALVQLSDACADQTAYAEQIAEQEGMLSVIGTEKMKVGFEPSFRIIRLVVYIVIILAAALAFVVLFTLATTNISERERELATIKVLGFFDKEVYAYVNKETLILTILGILLGLPAGTIFGEWLMAILNLPSIYFEACIYPVSYIISALLAFVFALVVNQMTNRTLNKIDPVEALKSIE